ncbi:MAG: hypothetical protein FD171_960 [Actinobacteria bacterium]|nr:MAG: hypothetical protein FD171_960 [Actinomycetota bacterium]
MVCVEVVDVVLGTAGGFTLGGLAGYVLGTRVRELGAWRYWTLNFLALVIGGLLNVAGLSAGKAWLWVGAIAFIVSSLTGLKYGRGLTTGRGSLDPPPEREPGPPSLWDDE